MNLSLELRSAVLNALEGITFEGNPVVVADFIDDDIAPPFVQYLDEVITEEDSTKDFQCYNVVVAINVVMRYSGATGGKYVVDVIGQSVFTRISKFNLASYQIHALQLERSRYATGIHQGQKEVIKQLHFRFKLNKL